MHILILGGTKFLGRHLTEAALKAGHEVTLFNRGQTNPDLFPQVEHVMGDRDGKLDGLQGRRWDVVVDTCGYVPRLVRAAAEALRDSVEQYVFISTISVYDELESAGMDESAPLQTLADPTTETITGETYGGLKVLCEEAAESVLPGRVLHVRSGLIIGPHDPTDRFTYWPVRVAQGGEVLAPGTPEGHTQFIDGRDQAEWIVRMAGARKSGVYNVTGPAEALHMGDVLAACQQVSGTDARFTWVDDAFLLEHEVAPFVQMPVWVPAAANNIQALSVRKALEDGLTFRPLTETIRDTLAWHESRPAGDLKAGISRERETELLAAWHAKTQG